MWLTGLVAPRHVGSSQTRARTRVPCIGRQILNHCATREASVLLFLFPEFCYIISEFYVVLIYVIHSSLLSLLNVFQLVLKQKVTVLISLWAFFFSWKAYYSAFYSYFLLTIIL